MAVFDINHSELKKQLHQGVKFELIDVRTAWEFLKGHIANSKNIPMDEVQVRTDEIDWRKKVVFICRSGARSMVVAEYFSRQKKNVYNLSGGVIAFGL